MGVLISLIIFCFFICMVEQQGFSGGRNNTCYHDKESDRALEGPWMESNNNTIQRCIDYCRGLRMTYAGVQYSRFCHCGDRADYDRHGPSQGCSMTCSGNPEETCGGSLALQVYTVCPRGFYTDPHSNRSCADRCHCEEDHICFLKNGTCPNGCQAGWKGPACNINCNINNGGCAQMCEDKLSTDWCYCNPGYEIATADNTLCTDINECDGQDKKGPCEHTCMNTMGSYECSCDEGYSLIDDHHCEDINECLVNGGKGPCEQLCNNTVGGYQCGCKKGYYYATEYTCAVAECWMLFDLQFKETSKVSSSCLKLKTLTDVSLEDCLKEACISNGNVVNVVSDVCDIRRCSDINDLKLSAQNGGWNVYVLNDGTGTPSNELLGQNTIYVTLPLWILLLAVIVPFMVIVTIVAIIGKLLYRKLLSHSGSPISREIHRVDQGAMGAARGGTKQTDGMSGTVASVSQESVYEEIKIDGKHEHYDHLNATTRYKENAAYEGIRVS